MEVYTSPVSDCQGRCHRQLLKTERPDGGAFGAPRRNEGNRSEDKKIGRSPTVGTCSEPVNAVRKVASADSLLVALDVESGTRARELAGDLRGVAGGFKIGSRLFTTEGPRVVTDLTGRGDRVFLDLKFHDIPNTVAGAVGSAVALGVRFATVHASGGKAMLAAAARAAEGTATTLLAVTVLTSLDSDDLAEIGFSGTAADSVLRLAGLAAREGIGGIVCSAQEVSAVRDRVGGSLVLVTPGVRLPEDAAGDQKRVVTPEEAVRRGADYIVVGRPITKARDPVSAARRFAAAMERGRRFGTA